MCLNSIKVKLSFTLISDISILCFGIGIIDSHISNCKIIFPYRFSVISFLINFISFLEFTSIILIILFSSLISIFIGKKNFKLSKICKKSQTLIISLLIKIDSFSSKFLIVFFKYFSIFLKGKGLLIQKLITSF